MICSADLFDLKYFKFYNSINSKVLDVFCWKLNFPFFSISAVMIYIFH